MEYDARKVIVDLGIIDGYVRTYCSGTDISEVTFEPTWNALDQVEKYVREAPLHSRDLSDLTYRGFLHDLGFIRGVLWQVPLPDFISEAMARVINFFAEHDKSLPQQPAAPTPCEPTSDFVSEQDRDFARRAIEAGIPVEEIAEELVLSPHEVERIATPEPTPIAVQVASTDEDGHGLSDDQVEIVRELSETMTDDEIAEHLGVSRHTVFRFRGRHGIEKSQGPREGRTRWEYQWEPWQKEALVEMKLAGKSYSEIGKAIGKTSSQCSGMWFWEKKKLEKRAAEADGPVPEDGLATADTPSPSPEPQATAVTIPAPADRWKPSPLSEDDWPDVQQMLASGRSREAIAGDFEVPVEDLNNFIAAKLEAARARHAAKESPPGESLAPALG